MKPLRLPFVSGDFFRFLADIIIEESTFNIANLTFKDNSIIFVKTDFIDKVAHKIASNNRKRYILITHNSDYSVPGTNCTLQFYYK
jgi:hypothetical protein